MNQKLKKFLDREIAEIKEHKNRLIAMAIASLILSGVLLFSGNEEASEIAKNENPPSVEKVAPKNRTEKKSEPRFKSIKGLERAAAEMEIINPFKVDIEKPQEPANKETESELENKPLEVEPVPKKPVDTPNYKESDKSIEPKDKVVLILKGTAISGDKKMAIIQRNIESKNDSPKSKSSNDNKSKSMMLKIGDKIDDKQIISIDKNFVIFDDGECLYLQEGQ